MNPLPFASLLAAALSLAAARGATVITFAGGTTNNEILSTFGDNVPDAGGVAGTNVTSGSGTPDIDLTWSASGSGSNVRWEYYTDSVWTGGVAQLNSAAVGNIYSVKFAPQAGFAVRIDSFNFFSYYASSSAATATNGQFSFDWAVVRDADGVSVTSGTTGLFTGGTASPAIVIGYTPTDSGSYTLKLTRTGGLGDNANIAVDNITFSQIAVPEPGAALLGVLGGVLLLRRRRN